MATSVVCFVCFVRSFLLDAPVLVMFVRFVGEDIGAFGEGVLGIDGSELGGGGDSSHVLNTDEMVCHFCEGSVEWSEVRGVGCSVVGVGCHSVVLMLAFLCAFSAVSGRFL